MQRAHVTRLLAAACASAAILALSPGCATTGTGPHDDQNASMSAGGTANVDSFKRAETDTYLAANVAQGALGRFVHVREPTPVDEQTVIRMNRDTLYSSAVFDLDAGDVTISLPDGDSDRFQSVQVIDQDHYTKGVFYEGQRTFTRRGVGTRYIIALVRTFVDPRDGADAAAAHAAQDAIGVRQAGPGSFEIPQWDQASLTRLRQALNAVAEANGGIDSARMFGDRGAVDPVQHLLGTAAGWGGNPREAAMYLGGVAPDNSGRTAYTMTLRDVPVDGFWSISVYNKDGFFEPNDDGVYTINNVTATPEADGSVVVRFGGDAGEPNTIPITDGWNYLIRLYRPRAEILDGSWTAPALEPVR
jgi:hypothetical protein